MYSPHIGIGQSLIVGGLAGLFYYYKLVHIGRSAGETVIAIVPKKASSSLYKREMEEAIKDREYGTYRYPPHIAFVLGVVLCVGVFCVTFVILNPLLQVSALSKDEVIRQWRNGTAALRVSTVFMCLAILRQSYAYFRSGFPDSSRVDKVREFPEMERVPELIDEPNRRLRDFIQSAIFIFSLSALWLVYADDVKDPVVAVISWGFLFFGDDWLIISDYSREMKGRILRWHRRRIAAANIVLLGSISYLIVHELGAAASVIWFLVIVPLSLLRYLFRLHPWNVS